VRTRLGEKYGTTLVPPNGPIPAHLLGNMWAQEWGTIYDVVAPQGTATTVDVTALLKAKHVDELGMVHYGENFFTSLGFAKLPETFWKRSLFLKPRDRDVVCHASAWDVDARDDLRVKMCIEVTAEFFQTTHHELGHNFYQRAYNTLPFLYQNGANDGFHEAIGDAIALSITPKYLQQVGLLAQIPPASGDTLLLLKNRNDPQIRLHSCDGFLDLAMGNLSGGESYLIQNNNGVNGTFSKTNLFSGLGTNNRSVAWGDYDNDGRLDLYLCKYYAENEIYHNNGDGTFTEVEAGVGDKRDSEKAAWFDYDRDGWLGVVLSGSHPSHQCEPRDQGPRSRRRRRGSRSCPGLLCECLRGWPRGFPAESGRGPHL
jgi:hypothetical protein